MLISLCSTRVQGWAGLIRVDGNTYTWMGEYNENPSVSEEAFTYTATKSIFTMGTPNGIKFNATFTNPIYPSDLKRHSQIASYLSIDVWSTDGNDHDVSVYTDITGEWASGDTNTQIVWETDASSDGKVLSHKFSRETQLAFSQIADTAEWGEWLFTGSANATYQTGADVDVRAQFSSNGALANSNDTNFRAIGDNWPVFALSQDLGKTQSASAVFSVGHYQEYAIQYLGEGTDVNSMPAYWTTFWDNAEDAASEFWQDYDYAKDAMTKVDDRVQADAVAAGGQDLATVVTLAYRQAYGGMQLVADPLNDNAPLVFLKEISSDGNVNTVDVIWPAMPIFLYDNPEWLRMLIDTIFMNDEAGHWPSQWAMHDLGGGYPNATGYPDGNDYRMSCEEPGNMVTMALIYAKWGGGTDYLNKHYATLQKWSNYIMPNCYDAVGDDNLSSDDFGRNGDHNANLGLKGIVAMGAMAEVATMIGKTDDAATYSQWASDHMTQWQTDAIQTSANPPHANWGYGETDSWGVLYSVFPDRLLGLNVVPQSVLDMQEAWYPTVAGQYGIPFNDATSGDKNDWVMWVASVSGDDLKSLIYSRFAKWINETPRGDLTDDFDVNTGGNGIGDPGFMNRPVVGGYFAPLAVAKGMPSS